MQSSEINSVLRIGYEAEISNIIHSPVADRDLQARSLEVKKQAIKVAELYPYVQKRNPEREDYVRHTRIFNELNDLVLKVETKLSKAYQKINNSMLPEFLAKRKYAKEVGELQSAIDNLKHAQHNIGYCAERVPVDDVQNGSFEVISMNEKHRL